VSRAWRVARLTTRLLNLTVLVTAGGYFIVYLYRWEWNRALISGLFFVAAEIALATVLILDALRRANLSTEDTREPGEDRNVARVVAAANRRPHFEWLRDSSSGFGVFIPVLLGTGVLLSALAWLVERLAGAVAGATVDRRTAALLGTGDTTVRAPRATQSDGPDAVAWVIAVLTTALIVGGLAHALRDATQSHSETVRGGTITLDVEVRQRRETRQAVEVVEALWEACRANVPRTADMLRLQSLADGTVRITVRPRLGDMGVRRLTGCFEDATLDLVSARVVDAG
jgi:hypothetical protein